MGVGFNRPEHTWSTPKITFLLNIRYQPVEYTYEESLRCIII